MEGGEDDLGERPAKVQAEETVPLDAFEPLGGRWVGGGVSGCL